MEVRSPAATAGKWHTELARLNPLWSAMKDDGTVCRVIGIQKIVSGGQTGADRAGLDFAIAHSVPHGGWCPKGRKAADGPIDDRYQLQETPGSDYLQRTEWNVRDSDGTVIFSIAPILTGGSLRTAELAQGLGKPCLHLSKEGNTEPPARILRAFIHRHNIQILNVAGPRASKEPDIGQFVVDILEAAIEHA